MIDCDTKKARASYHRQKSSAKRRGIGWELTFEQWILWWGDDIKKRGSGRNNLQMQRHNDSGPYALGNIRKGYPRENSKTYSNVHANRKAEKARVQHEAFLDALMFALSAQDEAEDEEFLRAKELESEISSNGYRIQHEFAADK